jgi:hypothetical protein
MAVTAHWLELGSAEEITLKAGLIGFLHIPGNHSGDRLGLMFYFIIRRAKLHQKVIYVLS